MLEVSTGFPLASPSTTGSRGWIGVTLGGVLSDWLKRYTPLARLWHTMADSMGVHVDRFQDSTDVISELV